MEAVTLGKSAFDVDKAKSDKPKEWTCNHCHAPAASGKKLHTCSGCHARHFCSQACLAAAWGGHAGHRVECLATTAMKECVDAGMNPY